MRPVSLPEGTPANPTTKTPKILKSCPGYQYQVEVQVEAATQKTKGIRNSKNQSSQMVSKIKYPKMTIAENYIPPTFLMGDTSTHSWWISS